MAIRAHNLTFLNLIQQLLKSDLPAQPANAEHLILFIPVMEIQDSRVTNPTPRTAHVTLIV